MDYQFRNLVFANVAVVATSFLAFLQNPFTGFVILGAVFVTDWVMLIRYLAERRRISRARRIAVPNARFRTELLRERCIGQGNCVALAPGAFALDAERKAMLLDRGAALALVLDAAKACPVDAIFVWNAQKQQLYPDPARPWQKKRARSAP